MNIKTFTSILTLALLTTALFSAPPTKEQIDEATKDIKLILSDTLNNPDSYKEGAWTFWIGKDAKSQPRMKVLHEYGASNLQGGIARDIILVCPSETEKWHVFHLRNWMAGDMDVGAAVLKDLEKEWADLPKEDVVIIKPKKTLGGVEIK